VSSDETRFGGSGLIDAPVMDARNEQRGAFPCTLRVTLPPLGIVFWEAPG